MKTEISFVVLLIFFTGLSYGEEPNSGSNVLVVPYYIRPGTKIRVTIILNDISSPLEAKVNFASKENSYSTATKIIHSKKLLLLPHQATDVDLEPENIESGYTYQISVVSEDSTILTNNIYFSDSKITVSVNPLQPIYFTDSNGLWSIEVKNNDGENIYLNKRDIEIVVFDAKKNIVARTAQIKKRHYSGFAMIVEFHLDHKIIPGDYKMVAIYKDLHSGTKEFKVFEYSPGPFNVGLSAGFKKISDELWLEVKVSTRRFDGEIVIGEMTIEFGDNKNLTATVRISGQTTYSLKANVNFLSGDRDLQPYLYVKVTVRDNRTGDINSAELNEPFYKLADLHNLPSIKELSDERYVTPGVPYLGKFQITGFQSLNSTVKFIYRFGNQSDAQNYTREISGGRLIRPKVFEVTVDHLFTMNVEVHYTVHYKGVEFSSKLTVDRYRTTDSVTIKARKVYDNRFGNYEIFCSEPMNRISYILKNSGSGVIKSGTIPINHNRVGAIQVDGEGDSIVLIHYSEQKKNVHATYIQLKDFDTHVDSDVDAKFQVLNHKIEKEIIGEKIEVNLELKGSRLKVPVIIVMDKLLRTFTGNFGNKTIDRVFRQNLVGDHGIVQVQTSFLSRSLTMVTDPITEAGSYQIDVYAMGVYGLLPVQNSEYSHKSRSLFTIGINAPKIMYLGESCEIEFVVTDSENIGGVAKIYSYIQEQYKPQEVVLARNERKIINSIFNAKYLGDQVITVQGIISYPNHTRSDMIEKTISIKRPPLVNREFNFINIKSNTTDISLDQFLHLNDNQGIEILFGRKLIDYLLRINGEVELDEFDRLVHQVATTIMDHRYRLLPPLDKIESRNMTTEIIMNKLMQYQNENGFFGPQPQGNDIWLTAYIVRMILIGGSEKLFDVDNEKLQKSIDLVFESTKYQSVDETVASHLKFVNLTTRPDIVERAISLMMLVESMDTYLHFQNFIQDSIDILLRGFGTSDIIAKVLAIHVLIRYQAVGFSSIMEVYPDSTQLNNMLNALAKQENEMMWWEVPHIDGYSKEEMDFVSLELTSIATITKGLLPLTELELTANYLLSRYSNNVPLIYWEALRILRSHYPEHLTIYFIDQNNTSFGNVNNASVSADDLKKGKLRCPIEKCPPGGIIIMTNHNLEEKFDKNLNVSIQVRKTAVEVCVKHPKESGKFVVELYLPTGVYADIENYLYKFEVALVLGEACRSVELHRRFNVLNPNKRLPVIVYEKNYKDKQNIYYAEYTNLGL